MYTYVISFVVLATFNLFFEVKYAIVFIVSQHFACLFLRCQGNWGCTVWIVYIQIWISPRPTSMSQIKKLARVCQWKSYSQQNTNIKLQIQKKGSCVFKEILNKVPNKMKQNSHKRWTIKLAPCSENSSASELFGT